jgi:HEAT repeat protein
MKRLIIALTCLVLVIGGAAGQTAKDVEEQIKILKTSKDAKQRVDACNELGELAQVKLSLVRPAVPHLLTALKDAEVEVRKAAISTLGFIEPYPREWVPNLLPLLADGEAREVRLGAVGILGAVETGAKEAIPLLEAIQKKENDKAEDQRDNDLINAAGQALEGIRDRVVAGAITTLQKDKAAKQRAGAAAELTKIGRIKVEQIKPAIPALLAAVKDEDASVRASALAALAIAGPEPGDLIPVLLEALRNVRQERGVRLQVIVMLGAAGPGAADAVPFLEVLRDREAKKAEDARDKELLEKVTQALEAIKKEQ